MKLDTMPTTMLEALELINEFKVKAPSSIQKPGVPFEAMFAASVLTKGAPKGKFDKTRSGKPGQPLEISTKEAAFGGETLQMRSRGTSG
jgi:hypothetical protein